MIVYINVLIPMLLVLPWPWQHSVYNISDLHFTYLLTSFSTLTLLVE